MIGLSRLSIIVPVYNRIDLFDRCIQSLININIPKNEYEIIIVDDYSDNNFSEIYKSYETENVKYLKLNKRTGMGQARIEGLNYSKSPYVAFVDSDDYVDPDFHRILLETLENDKNCSLAIGPIIDWCSINNTHKITYKPNSNIIKKEHFIDYFMRGGIDPHCMVIWNKVMKRELLEGLNLPIGKPASEEFGYMFPIKDRMNYARIVNMNSYYWWTQTTIPIQEKYSYFTSGVLENLYKFSKRDDLTISQRTYLFNVIRYAKATNRQYLRTHDSIPEC